MTCHGMATVPFKITDYTAKHTNCRLWPGFPASKFFSPNQLHLSLSPPLQYLACMTHQRPIPTLTLPVNPLSKFFVSTLNSPSALNSQPCRFCLSSSFFLSSISLNLRVNPPEVLHPTFPFSLQLNFSILWLVPEKALEIS